MSEQNTTPEIDENKIIAERRAKLDGLRKTGQAYPNTFRRDVLAMDLQNEYATKTKAELAEMQPVRVKVAGRMMTRRIMGKASFATLQDMSGRIQAYVTRDDLPEGFYNDQFKKWDLGDIVGSLAICLKPILMSYRFMSNQLS